MEIIKYKDFEGSVETDIQRNCCHGKILFIDDLVTYESATLKGLQKQFEEAVDDYLETCILVGKEPQKPFRGLFNVRVKPELHRAAVKKAAAEETSLNDLVSKALESYLSREAMTIKSPNIDSFQINDMTSNAGSEVSVLRVKGDSAPYLEVNSSANNKFVTILEHSNVVH